MNWVTFEDPIDPPLDPFEEEAGTRALQEVAADGSRTTRRLQNANCATGRGAFVQRWSLAVLYFATNGRLDRERGTRVSGSYIAQADSQLIRLEK